MAIYLPMKYEHIFMVNGHKVRIITTQKTSKPQIFIDLTFVASIMNK